MGMDFATLSSTLTGQYDATQRVFTLNADTLGSTTISELLSQSLNTDSITINDSDGPTQSGQFIVVEGTGSLYGFTNVTLQASFWLDDVTGDTGNPEMSVAIQLPESSPWSFTGYFTQLSGTVFDDITVASDPPPRFVFASAAYADNQLLASFGQGMNFYGAVEPGGTAFGFLSSILGSLLKTTLSGPIEPHDYGPTMNLVLDYDNTLQQFFPELDIPVTIALKSEFDPADKGANVGVQFSVSFTLGGDSITLYTLLTKREVGVLNVMADVGSISIPGPEEIAKLIGAGDLVSSLPPKYQVNDSILIKAMGFGISARPLKVTDVWIQLVPAQDGWEIVPGIFELKNISALFKVQNPLAQDGTRSVQALVFATLQVTEDDPILQMDLHAFDVGGEFTFQATLAEDTTFNLTDLIAKFLPEVTDAPDLVFDNLGLYVHPTDTQTQYGFSASFPEWSVTIGHAELDVEEAAISLDNFSNNGSTGGQITGGINVFGVLSDFSYTLPGTFRIVTIIPQFQVDFQSLASNVIQGWKPPSWFPSFTFPDTEIHLERDEDNGQATYTFLLVAEPENLGVIFLQVKNAGQWGVAAGLDLQSPKISSIPGLESLAPFDSTFQLNDLMFVISSMTDEHFQFPDQSSFSNPQIKEKNIQIPQQSGGLQQGFNLFASMTLGGSQSQDMMRKFLGVDADASLAITLQVGEDPMTSSSLFLSITGQINDKTTFTGSFGAAMQNDIPVLFLDATLNTELKGTSLQFEIRLTIVETGALLSGIYDGPALTFEVVQLKIRAIEIGIDWEGVPSLGFIAEIDVEGFDSSLALFVDSSDPANSMAAGAVSNLTLKDVVDTLAGNIIPIPPDIDGALAQVDIKGLSAFTMPVNMPGLGDISAALNNNDIATIASAFQQADNMTIPSTSEGVMLSTSPTGGLWYLTDLSTMNHYELQLDGGNIDVSLEAQFYFVPSPTGATIAGKYPMPQGYKIQGELDFFDLKVQANIQINQNTGISVDVDMDPIVIGSDDFLVIKGYNGQGGPSLSLSTYDDPKKTAPYDKKHFFLSAYLSLLGVSDNIWVYVLPDQVQFDLTGDIVQDINYNLSGHFDGLSNFGGGGSADVSINTTFDFGELGQVPFNMTVTGNISFGWNGSAFTATCGSQFDFEGVPFTVPDFNLDIDGQSLTNLVGLLEDEIRDQLDDWLHVMDNWLQWFDNGIIAGVTDCEKVLEDVFGVVSGITNCPTTTAVQMMAREPGAPRDLASDDNLDWLRQVRTDLGGSAMGQYWLNLYDSNKDEANNLIQTNSDVQQAVKAQDGQDVLINILNVLRFNAAIDGVKAGNALVVIGGALLANGSAQLRLAILKAEQGLPQYYGQTYTEVLQAMSTQTPPAE